MSTSSNTVITIDDNTWNTLNDVNMEVNRRGYRSDTVQYGKPDYWELIEANGGGDCEDYALTKRYELVKRGFPFDAMRLVLCWTEGLQGPGTGEYHAVLSLTTDKGTLILDNRRWDIRNYLDLPYKWDLIEDTKTRKWLPIRM